LEGHGGVASGAYSREVDDLAAEDVLQRAAHVLSDRMGGGFVVARGFVLAMVGQSYRV
jgi:hypothetical protein